MSDSNSAIENIFKNLQKSIDCARNIPDIMVPAIDRIKDQFISQLIIYQNSLSIRVSGISDGVISEKYKQELRIRLLEDDESSPFQSIIVSSWIHAYETSTHIVKWDLDKLKDDFPRLALESLSPENCLAIVNELASALVLNLEFTSTDSFVEALTTYNILIQIPGALIPDNKHVSRMYTAGFGLSKAITAAEPILHQVNQYVFPAGAKNTAFNVFVMVTGKDSGHCTGSINYWKWGEMEKFPFTGPSRPQKASYSVTKIDGTEVRVCWQEPFRAANHVDRYTISQMRQDSPTTAKIRSGVSYTRARNTSSSPEYTFNIRNLIPGRMNSWEIRADFGLPLATYRVDRGLVALNAEGSLSILDSATGIIEFNSEVTSTGQHFVRDDETYLGFFDHLLNGGNGDFGCRAVQLYPDILQVTRPNGPTFLILACILDKASLARDLVYALEKASPEVVTKTLNLPFHNDKGRTALWFACRINDWTLVDLLLTMGAEPNALPTNRVTALMRSCRKERYSIVERLLNGGANVDIKDTEGRTARHKYYNTSDEVQRLLRWRGSWWRG